MDDYANHNLFRISLDRFLDADPQLMGIEGLRYVHPLDWWKGIDWDSPGIYLLTGGRQIGKTTSTKLLIKYVLQKKMFHAANIFYLPCDQIDDHHALGQILRRFLAEIGGKTRFLLIIDEVTYVREWDRAVKALADEGFFRRGFCIITGSDSIVLKDAVSRFPGRRGVAGKTDFHLAPLNFREYIELTDPGLLKDVTASGEKLFDHFADYLKCGGHLRAINDLHQKGHVLPATHAVFEQWIRGDFQKRSKSAIHLTGILKALFETSGSQVTYSSLAGRVGEMSKPTLIDYCHLLERLDIIFDLQAFDQNHRTGFPRKARKFHFWDPFIFDTVHKWLEREFALPPAVDLSPAKAESVVAAHFKRFLPTFYFKGAGEVDVVTLFHRRPFFIEVKWTSQVRSWDLGELKKNRLALILAKSTVAGKVGDIAVLPIAGFLADTEKFLGRYGQ